MIIDVHCHDGAWPMDGRDEKYDYLGNTMDEFIGDLDADGVSHCMISSVRALTVDMVDGNAETFADAELDDRILAYVYYDPTRIDESSAEIEKYRGHSSFIGFKTRPAWHGLTIDDPSYEPLFERIASVGMPLLLHTWTRADAEAIVKVGARHEATIIMAHAAAEHYKDAAKWSVPHENILIDAVTSAHHPGKIRYILDKIGKDRVLYGSDYGLFSRARVIACYDEAKLSSEEEDAVYRGNAARIFGLDG